GRGAGPGGGGGGAVIRLTKVIPAAAGLGGGSSDAAAVLMALHRLWNLSLPWEEVLALGLTLGADVPIFLGGSAALAEGVGERLTPWPDLPEVPLVLVNPGVPLATAQVFKALAGPWPDPARPLPLPQARATPSDDVAALAALLENDLEPVSRRLQPAIGAAAEALRQAGARGVLMSGSGPTVFGLFVSDDEAHQAARTLGAVHPHWLAIAGRTANRHPFEAEWAAWRQSRTFFP
ncbi:MAG: 4-(cytidine 5'-diphospho)-2-C-methyl-D-erythritol kinase, partial [Magnetococcales bacterium]|nr:4-(cytidine 5'-diphospho)-2-C-methyl-D-erythritol kinase [Magnetococcales bacterium]